MTVTTYRYYSKMEMLVRLSAMLLVITASLITASSGSQLAIANNKFALKMYRNEVDKAGRWGNVVFSPLSITMATGLLHVGARSNTRKQINDVMEFGDVGNTQDLYKEFLDFIKIMEDPETNYTLRLANRLFGRNNYTYLDSFLQDTQQFFKASLKQMDFVGAADESRLEINNWVANITENKIKDLLREGMVGPSTVLVLVNAVYFKAGWAHVFDNTLTKKQNFSLTNTDKFPTDMMQPESEVELQYAVVAEWGCRIVELPYLKDEIHMYVIVPDEIEGIDGVEAKLDMDELENVIKNKMYATPLVLTFPKFKQTLDVDLKKAFQNLGISDLFDAGVADLSGINGVQGLYASDAVHKAFIEVDEVGTEAAAATAVVIKETAAADPIIIKVDRPFLFLIREKSTGMVMFMGRFVLPDGSESMVPDLKLTSNGNSMNVQHMLAAIFAFIVTLALFMSHTNLY